MSTAITWLSIIAAIIAAGCWLASGLVQLPAKFTSGLGGSGGATQAVVDAMRQQSRWSSVGAIAAAVAVLAQAALIWLSQS
jgi:hypothetical protein